jgi:hypothetical protein
VRRICAVLFCALLSACSSISVQTGVYQTLEEARAAGAIERGWIPQGLPASASDLREGHLDDGRGWGVFMFDTAHADALRALLGAEIHGEPVTCEAPGRLEWWPRILRSPIDLSAVATAGLQLYHSKDDRWTYAVNWRQGRAYYWRG